MTTNTETMAEMTEMVTDLNGESFDLLRAEVLVRIGVSAQQDAKEAGEEARFRQLRSATGQLRDVVEQLIGGTGRMDEQDLAETYTTLRNLLEL